jgi:hypothetical protein
MTSDRRKALEALLSKTEAAHGAYQSSVLNGVYDEDWARWYAQYAVDNGIGALAGAPVAPEELAGFFTASWEEAQRGASTADEPWATQTARRIEEEMAPR